MLNKWNLKVAEFASQEESPYNLKAILVTDKETVGTNGHYLVWVGTPAEHKAESFPVIDHAPKIQDSYSSFLLGVDDAKKVLAALPKKPTIPILATAGVAVKDGQPILEVTDLGCPQVFRPRPPDGKFPNWEVVIPNKKPVFRIAVNAAYLAKVAKMCAEFRNDSRPSVVMSFYGDAEAIRFDVEGRDDRYYGGERQQGMTAMLMPLYLSSATTDDDVRYSYGWAEREAKRQAGSVLIWALLCVLVVFGIAFQSFKPSVGSYFVPEGSRALLTKNVSVGDAPIDNSHFVDSLVAFSARYPLDLLGVWGSSTISHSKWNRGTLDGLSGLKIRHSWEALYHLKFSNNLSYPCRVFPGVTATQHCIRGGSAISMSTAALKHLEPFAARLFGIGLYVDHNPSPFDSSARAYLGDYPTKQKDSEEGDYGSGDCVKVINPFWRVAGAVICFSLVWIFAWPCVNGFVDGGWGGTAKAVVCLICGFCSIIAAAIFASGRLCLVCAESGCESQQQSYSLHIRNTVPHKYSLTRHNYWGTVIGIGRTDMPNVLSTDKQVAVISALAEGSGIRQIERITGVHRDTIMRLGVRVGKGCASLLDRKMRNLYCNHLQFDEVWGFIGKKERHCTADDSLEVGDVWTFCAIDSDTKLVPSFKVGKRDAATANAFVADIASRLKNRVQISSDALRAYVEAVERAFGANVDFAQIVKTYVHEDAQNAERKYSAPEFVIEEKKAVAGFPDMRLASTSHIERLNGTTRLHMRRLTRLTYAFSKKRENFEAAVALHFAYYNFVKRHNSLRCTPAMAAGIEREFWTVKDLLGAAA